MTEVALTAREELEQIAEVLREADFTEKEAKKLKEEVRPAFFELISEVVRDEVPLARKTVTVDITLDFDAHKWQEFNEPTWRIVALQPEGDGGAATRMKITLEENDEFKKFEFVANGYKFGRTIRMEGKDFKAASFLDGLVVNETLDPKLLKLLKSIVTKTKVVTYEYSVDENKALAVMSEYPETVAIFQQYMFPGTPKPALMPIKEAKEND